MQFVSNAMPDAVTVSWPFRAVVHSVEPVGCAVGEAAPPVGVGLLIANSRPWTLPYAPSIRLCSVSSYQPRYTSLLAPTAIDGCSPAVVPGVSITEKALPSPDARRTSSVPGSYHVTYTVPSSVTATPVERPSTFGPVPTCATVDGSHAVPSFDVAVWTLFPA